MKKIIILILIFWCSVASAMYRDRGAIIDEYDPATGYYYKSWIEDDTVVNLFIYDAKSNSGKMLFQGDQIYPVSEIIYEYGYDQEERTMKFGGEYSSAIKNNYDISKRAPKDKLLIVTTDKKAKASILWTADKSGKNLKRILTVDFTDDWHLDVKNSKIRIVKADKNSFIMNEMEW